MLSAVARSPRVEIDPFDTGVTVNSRTEDDAPTIDEENNQDYYRSSTMTRYGNRE